jgi:WD40 repeat protein
MIRCLWKWTTFFAGFLWAAGSLTCFSLATAQGDDYTDRIQPILQAHCVGCHNPDEAEGGLDLSTYEAMLQGGRSGPALTPGATASSRVHLLATRNTEPAMPPDPADALSESQLQVLADWIQAGAQGPAGSSPRPTLRVPKVAIKHSKPAAISSVSLSPDLQTMAFGQTARVVLANVHRLQPNATLDELAKMTGLSITGFSGKVNSVQFSADGRRLIVGTGIAGLAGDVHVLDLDEVRPILAAPDQATTRTLAELPHRTFTGHRDLIYAAVMSPDEKWLATAGYDRLIKVWKVADQSLHGELPGHNGAVFDLCFTPDSASLLSASADQTVKVWDVTALTRNDTLGQPEGEVNAVRFLPGPPGTGIPRVIAIATDNRLRVWHWDPTAKPVPNPLLETRFIDESPLVVMAVDAAGEQLAIASQTGSLKLVSTRTWEVLETLKPLGGTPSGLVFSADGQTLWATDLNGKIQARSTVLSTSPNETIAQARLEPKYLPDSEIQTIQESERAMNPSQPNLVPPNVRVAGAISQPNEVDRYSWTANAGEVWAIDVDPVGINAAVSPIHPTLPATGDASALDPLITILGHDDRPVLQTRLQAIRESYFTFRGKDSMQADDFRLFGQQDMRLDQFLYASGEVTRLWMHPRGPDSGFDVYPGGGERWTYFGTSHVTHALSEPAYIVQPLADGQSPLDNGLPAFDIPYRNDDDPARRAGKGSRLLFTAPHDGPFTVAVQDARLFGGDNFHYQLRIRPARPDFQAKVTPVSAGLLPGAGREFTVSIERFDGFDGPVEFAIDGLPPGVAVSSPIVIEPGQKSAQGTIWIEADQSWPDSVQPVVMAKAEILGESITRPAGDLGVLKKADTTQVVPWIVALTADDAQPVSLTAATDGQAANVVKPQAYETVLRVRRGGTISAKVVVERSTTQTGEVSFGNALAARNPAHGVIVDNIGLNGLLLLTGMNEREFFITAEAKTTLGRRPFFLKAEIDGGITTLPIWLEVIE